MKKVLLITYYWPPAGGPGVQRVLYFVKYLREFGWEPVVYTVEKGEYHNIDNSFEDEIPEGIVVLKTPVREPHQFYKRLVGKNKEETLKPVVITEKTERPFLQKLAVWIRGNFFIPDARMWWIRPSVRYLHKYLNDHPVDAIVTSSPPQSVHLIGKKVSSRMQIPWIADFRDPWTGVNYFEELNLSRWAEQKHRRMEKEVLQTAEKVISVGWSMASDFERISNRPIQVITNGYEKPDTEFQMNPTYEDPMRILYIGSLSRKRNPETFWVSLHRWVKAKGLTPQNINFLFVGNVEATVFEFLDKIGLGSYYSKKSYVPHNEVWKYLSEADLLLLIGIPEKKDILTGKVFEYLVTRKPIFAISPQEGDISRLIKESEAGLNSDFEDEDQLMRNFIKMYDLYEESKLHKSFKVDEELLEGYSRRSLTRRLAGYLDEIVL